MINQNQKKNVLNRLNKIEGQIRGVNRMITEDRYFPKQGQLYPQYVKWKI